MQKYEIYFILLSSMNLQNSTRLRCMTLPTCNCSLYCVTIVGDILRFNAYRTTSKLASLHSKIAGVPVGIELASFVTVRPDCPRWLTWNLS